MIRSEEGTDRHCSGPTSLVPITAQSVETLVALPPLMNQGNANHRRSEEPFFRRKHGTAGFGTMRSVQAAISRVASSAVKRTTTGSSPRWFAAEGD